MTLKPPLPSPSALEAVEDIFASSSPETENVA